MEYLKTIYNDFSKSYTLFTIISIISSIILVIDTYYKNNIDYAYEEKKMTILFGIIAIFFSVFCYLLNKSVSRTYHNSKYLYLKIKSRLNLFIIISSFSFLIYVLFLNNSKILISSVVLFIHTIVIIMAVIFMKDKYSSLNDFLFVFHKISIPDTHFSVSWYSIKFKYKNMNIYYHKINDTISIDNFEINTNDFKQYLISNNIGFKELNEDYLNLLKIFKY